MFGKYVRLYLSEKYSGTLMAHASNKKQTPMREEEMKNYRHCLTHQIF